ncbi:hypothetical protein PIB30_013092 [Stylosanthes scabra]|uniref:Uncharacterized protein n=1 Tax=Stylosanthes scabra TaxID=79078 RepID=A0ABU6V6M9_9FABA|nr:hypothetical protein [Stylosanthes scabra]
MKPSAPRSSRPAGSPSSSVSSGSSGSFHREHERSPRTPLPPPAPLQVPRPVYPVPHTAMTDVRRYCNLTGVQTPSIAFWHKFAEPVGGSIGSTSWSSPVFKPLPLHFGINLPNLLAVPLVRPAGPVRSDFHNYDPYLSLNMEELE